MCVCVCVSSPAGEFSDWAMRAAMAELGFSRLPNIWDGAGLKVPDNEFDCSWKKKTRKKINNHNLFKEPQ